MRKTAIRHVAPAFASALLVLSTGAAGHAQDGRGFFEQLFGGAPQSSPQPAPQSGGLLGTYYENGGETRYQRSVRRPPRLRARYAALPKTDSDAKLAGKQPVDQKAIADNPTKAILADPTLRPGDIVVLPSGPRVFTGSAGKTHRISDFEDVKQSDFVDRKTRQKLLAMMVPVGAMPADQARKVLAQKRKLARPDEIGEVEAAQAAQTIARNETGTRVINPWIASR